MTTNSKSARPCMLFMFVLTTMALGFILSKIYGLGYLCTQQMGELDVTTVFAGVKAAEEKIFKSLDAAYAQQQ